METGINWGKMSFGIGLFLFGLLIPYVLRTDNMGIYDDLIAAVATGEAMLAVQAAFKLVMLNSLRATPHYLGTFFCGEALNVRNKGWGQRFIKMLVLCGTIPLIYQLIQLLHGISYDFGIPAILVLGFIIIYWLMDFNMVNPGKKLMMIITAIMAIQWLDVMPGLSGYAFGRGEASYDIKMVADMTGGTEFLQGASLVFFVFLLMTTLLLSKLIMDENQLMVMSRENKESQRILLETRMRVLENRTYMELHQLVHDLKSPLTSIQTLVGVVQMSGEEKNEHLRHIDSACERMNGMITEILDENRKKSVLIDDMLTDIMAKISDSEYARLIRLTLAKKPICAVLNQIRFTRAVINLLENAFYAVDPQSGYIHLGVNWGNSIAEIYVEDNGQGISADQLDAIWEHGYSTRSSLGLGLQFVKKVVSDSGGEILVRSAVGSGTRFSIKLPAEEVSADGYHIGD